MPPSGARSNRVEVDLRLLQDANLEKLQTFGTQFRQSVDSLGKYLEKYAEEVTGLTTVATGADLPNTSDARNVRITGSATARLGGVNTSQGAAFYNSGRGGGGGYDGGQDSIAPGFGAPGQPPHGGGGAPYPGSNFFERQYIRAQRAIGTEVPVGVRQLTGYMAEGVLWRQPSLWRRADGSATRKRDEAAHWLDDNGNPILDREGNPMPQPYLDEEGNQIAWGQQGARKLNEFVGVAQTLQRNASLMGAHLANVRNGIMGFTQTGQNFGLDRTNNGGNGILGWVSRLSGLGGPAFDESFSQQWNALKQSWFGLNPNYSTAQAKAALQVAQEYGWTGAQSSFLTNQMKLNQINHNIAPQTTAAILDGFMRFGGPQNFAQLNNVISAMPAVARAASMNLSDLQQQITSLAQSAAQATGMSTGTAAGALEGFTMATGLNPQVAEGTLSNSQNLYLASQMTGQNLWQLTTGNNQMAPMMAFGTRLFSSAVGGMTPQEIMSRLRSKNPAVRNQAQQMMSNVERLYLSNHNLFGGLSPQQMLQQGLRAGSWQGILNRISVDQQLATLDPTKSTNWDAIIRKYGGGAAAVANNEHFLDTTFAEWAKKHPDAARDPEKAAQEKQQILLNHFADQTKKRAQKAAQQYTIGMTSQTKKYFTLLNGAFGNGNKSQSNIWTRAENYAESAMHALEKPETALHILDIATNPIGALFGS